MALGCVPYCLSYVKKQLAYYLNDVVIPQTSVIVVYSV